MRFILTCTLGPDVEKQRLALRGKHLDYVARNQSTILFGGPSLGPAGAPEAMTLVIEAEDLGAAERFIHAEPYTANKVFSDVKIRRWAQVVPEPHPGALAEEIAREAAKADTLKGATSMNPTYVLVHGAWMGAWAWDDVAAGLRAKGATVVAVELPGHGADTTPLPGANLAAYVAKVGAAVDAAGGRVILVGHSMAGMVITQVAELKADKVEKLVYLAAYLPKDGQKLLDLALTDADSHAGRNLKLDEKNGIGDIPKEFLQDGFLADGSPAALAKLQANYRPEPLAGFVAPVTTTAANWGRVPKVYIYTKQDRAVSYALQQRMTAGIPLASTVTLDTSHAPFLSNPTAVVDVLVGI